MAIGEHAIVSGSYSTQSITSNTNVRDVSNVLDLWAHKWTPILNRISWGPDSGGLVAEWVTEHLGWGYITNSAQVVSITTTFVMKSIGTGHDSLAELVKMVPDGTMLYAKKNSGSAAIWIVQSIASSYTLTFTALLGISVTLTAESKLYVIGHFANEGSSIFPDTSRKRILLSNKFAILRKDVRITGSEAATDMYAVSSEPNHQNAMRLIEMQREREWSVLYSSGQARSSTVASYIYGAFGFLNSVSSNAWVDTTTTTLAEKDVNDMAARCWDYGAEGPFVLCGEKSQIRKFTQWDQARVRTTPDAKLGGHFINRYMTDVNIEVELVPLRQCPVNLLFMLDINNMKLRAKNGRKLIFNKVADDGGDYTNWYFLSEYTLEMRGYEKGYHAMWTALT
jgi:hypothetical protein